MVPEPVGEEVVGEEAEGDLAAVGEVVDVDRVNHLPSPHVQQTMTCLLLRPNHAMTCLLLRPNHAMVD